MNDRPLVGMDRKRIALSEYSEDAIMNYTKTLLANVVIEGKHNYLISSHGDRMDSQFMAEVVQKTDPEKMLIFLSFDYAAHELDIFITNEDNLDSDGYMDDGLILSVSDYDLKFFDHGVEIGDHLYNIDEDKITITEHVQSKHDPSLKNEVLESVISFRSIKAFYFDEQQAKHLMDYYTKLIEMANI